LEEKFSFPPRNFPFASKIEKLLSEKGLPQEGRGMGIGKKGGVFYSLGMKECFLPFSRPEAKKLRPPTSFYNLDGKPFLIRKSRTTREKINVRNPSIDCKEVMRWERRWKGSESSI
jgi:hypothetical protein